MLSVAFEIDYFSLHVEEGKETLKIFREVIDCIDYISPIMYELSKNHLVS